VGKILRPRGFFPIGVAEVSSKFSKPIEVVRQPGETGKKARLLMLIIALISSTCGFDTCPFLKSESVTLRTRASVTFRRERNAKR
jgi:hypothetical protein